MAYDTIIEDGIDVLVVGAGLGGTGAAWEARFWGQDKKIVIAEKAKRGAALDIYAMDLAARESVNVTADCALRPGAPTWKSDGRYLYFDAGIGGSRHLFRASASGLESLERVEFMVHRYHHQTEWWDEHLSGAAASSQ